MRPIRLLPLSFASLLLSACAWQVPWLGATPTAEKSTANVAEKQSAAPSSRNATLEFNDAYKLDSGDRVRIVVAGQDWLSNSYEIDSSGAVDIPSFGKVTARGLNTVKLSAAIARRLKQKNVREAHVAVQVETYRPFTIRGGVANPGQYPYVNNMTTETAIAIAGGLKPGADKNAVKVSGEGQGGAARAPSSLGSLVQPGDTVIVSEER